LELAAGKHGAALGTSPHPGQPRPATAGPADHALQGLSLQPLSDSIHRWRSPANHGPPPPGRRTTRCKDSPAGRSTGPPNRAAPHRLGPRGNGIQLNPPLQILSRPRPATAGPGGPRAARTLLRAGQPARRTGPRHIGTDPRGNGIRLNPPQQILSRPRPATAGPGGPRAARTLPRAGHPGYAGCR
jgi:hypothetical protein